MTRNKTVTITVHEVGEKFAECAIVRKNGRKLYRSVEVPYGFGSVAYANAICWAETAGYQCISQRFGS